MRAKRLALSIGALFAATGALAQATERKLQTAAGQEVRLAVLVHTKPDCTPGAPPDFRLDVAPANGWLVVRNGKTRLAETAKSCKGTEQQAAALFYRPKPGFTGEDHVGVEFLSSDGPSVTQTITITVAAKP